MTEGVDPGGFLDNRRWWRASAPFPYVRAPSVFQPHVATELAEDFRARLDAGLFARDIPGYDVSAQTLTDANAGPFSVFLSRTWHDLIARLFGVQATGDINVTLHHHAPGSASGTPHNDLNPGWFVPDGRTDGITIHDPAKCDYRHGNRPDAVCRVRAIALLYYLADPPWQVQHGGQTSFYTRSSDSLDRPTLTIAPVANSLLAFPCTPFSFHAFRTNIGVSRDCLVMWWHRPWNDAVRRWGEASIVGW